jgi:hypothetical protein
MSTNKIIFIVLTLVFLFSCNPIDNLQEESITSECKVPLELVILIDESINIENNIFDDIIFKSIEIIDNLRFDFKEIKVSVLSYSNKINEIIIWSENIQLIKNKLLNMNYYGRKSSSSSSEIGVNKMNPTIVLDKITSVFLRTDFERIKMTLWFTDASNLNNDDYTQLKQHSKLLKSISHLFVISTNNKRLNNENKLKQLASSPKSLFNLNTLNLFYKLISDITSFACKRKVKTSNRLLNKNNNSNNNNNSLNKSNAINMLLDLFGYRK